MLPTTQQHAIALKIITHCTTLPGIRTRISSCRSIICQTLYLDIIPGGRCLEHIVNLTNIAVMGHITKIVAIENATAIWEYDPELPDNRVLGGSLDVITSVRTLAIKVRRTLFLSDIYMLIHFQIQSSGQSIEFFQKLQERSCISPSLKILLHSGRLPVRI